MEVEEIATIPLGERHHVEYLSDLFAVILAIEKLEKVVRRDIITQEQYEVAIHRLLEKYMSTVSHLEHSRNPYYTTIESFWESYGSECPAARTRIRQGFDGTKQHQEEGTVNPRLVLECGQHFITLMDSLKLQQTAVDQLYTLLTDLIRGLHRVGASEQDFFSRLVQWKEKLDTMKASDELNERDAREFAFALECSYQTFHAFLGESSTQGSK
ncbi:putative VPS28 protein [Trypanosoma vivax]|uniref:Vacuolar protein sorting-associated protein 28 homolog n=1 Tax=Trypanosoma vivax (strain Y486) TaxID=1055687 RepID=G0UCX1_TRYVY|nr:putative vacuolar sorting-associated protein-like [Trypanosoma vivax]KAH8608134.1 putative VPS28 protein [Trypanosoma vivax]CCC53681.1 putative vacuolar sorting-associated protein-like [Trypanosoma vivax Y486]